MSVSTSQRYRLVTRSDFDGLVCAMLLKELDLIDEITFVHPKDVQDGAVAIGARDITTNLPYQPSAHLVFDHHFSETVRTSGRADNHVIDPEAPSAARVVYEYYGGREAFPRISEEMMVAVDKADSARYTLSDILHPSGWVLLNFLMDARTGLGRFRQFRISNYELMMQLIDFCLDHSVDQVLQLPDVRERVELYFEQSVKFQEQVKRCATVRDNVVVLDLRAEDEIHAGNRFVVYALFPECNVSIHVLWGKQKQNTVFAVGKSIVNPSSDVNIGELCLTYGGGGHANAGTCQVAHEDAERVLVELVTALRDS